MIARSLARGGRAVVLSVGLAAASGLLAAAFAAPAGANDVAAAGWELKRRSDAPDASYTLYARPRAGSSFAEYRMEVPLEAEPERVMAALEHNLIDPDTYPDGFERVVLRREGSTVISHDTIQAPFVATRDVVIRIEVGRDPETGAPCMRWSAVRGASPPPREGVVRMPSSEGSWTLHPRKGGGTLAVYRSHVDLGGSVPSALVETRMPEELARQASELRRTMRDRLLARR